MVKVGTEAPARWRKPPANRYSLHPRQPRLSSTLHCGGRRRVWRALEPLGFSCQRPKIRCYQPDAEAVKNWKERGYPKLVARAGESNAVIVFAHEAGMRSDYHVGKTWIQRGETPTAKFTGKRFQFNMLAAISPEGPIYCRLHEGTATAWMFCEFLQHIADATGERPMYVVADQVSVHKATEIAEWLAGRKGKEIKLHYLPTYSPELNPAEAVWSLLKGTAGKEVVKTKSGPKDRLRAAFEALKKSLNKVQKFFSEPHCLYTVSRLTLQRLSENTVTPSRAQSTAKIINTVAGRLPLLARRPAHPEMLISSGSGAKCPPLLSNRGQVV